MGDWSATGILTAGENTWTLWDINKLIKKLILNFTLKTSNLKFTGNYNLKWHIATGWVPMHFERLHVLLHLNLAMNWVA